MIGRYILLKQNLFFSDPSYYDNELLIRKVSGVTASLHNHKLLIIGITYELGSWYQLMVLSDCGKIYTKQFTSLKDITRVVNENTNLSHEVP